MIGVVLTASSILLLFNRPIHHALNLRKTASVTNATALSAATISDSPASRSNTQGAAAADSALSDTEKAALFVNRGTELFQQGKIEAAAHDYAEAARLTPEDETAHFNLGVALARLGKFEEAKAQYEEAVRIFPEYTDAHNNLGNLLASHGELTQAIEHLTEALKLSPQSALSTTISAGFWRNKEGSMKL